MERRVIKFNLMGAIGVLLLIIATIVGITVFAINKKNGSNKESNPKNQQQQQQQIPENTDAYKEIDMKESVDIGGEKVELIIKPFESELNYKMNLASEKFYFDKNEDGKDIFKSQESDSILMEISKVDQGFNDKKESLINGQTERRGINESYRMNAIDINGKLVYIDQEKIDGVFYFNYYINKDDMYYIVNVHCDDSFTNNLVPVIDAMLNSFEIM